jgi:hypothetical protein
VRLDHKFRFLTSAKGRRQQNQHDMHVETLRGMSVGQNYRLQDIQLTPSPGEGGRSFIKRFFKALSGTIRLRAFGATL